MESWWLLTQFDRRQRDATGVLTLHNMFLIGTTWQEHFFCSLHLLYAMIFAAPHYFCRFHLLLYSSDPCNYMHDKRPTSGAMTKNQATSQKSGHFRGSFPFLRLNVNLLLRFLLVSCLMFAATAKSCLHNATRYASQIFEIFKDSIHVP